MALWRSTFSALAACEIIRSKTLPNGSRQITAFLLPGDFCDLHVTILGEMDHDIQAVTQTKVAFIPHAVMQQLPEDRPALARAFRWATLVDEAVLRSWTVSMGRRDSLQRVSHLICELHARLELVELVEDDTFSLPVTQEVIADAVGLTPVHVNRTLMRLRYDGLIALAARSLTIFDVPGLRKLAGFNLNYLHRSPLKRI